MAQTSRSRTSGTNINTGIQRTRTTSNMGLVEEVAGYFGNLCAVFSQSPKATKFISQITPHFADGLAALVEDASTGNLVMPRQTVTPGTVRPSGVQQPRPLNATQQAILATIRNFPNGVTPEQLTATLKTQGINLGSRAGPTMSSLQRMKLAQKRGRGANATWWPTPQAVAA